MESNQLNNTPNEDAVIELLTLTCNVDKYGSKRYYDKEGRRHRIHGPAIIHPWGSQYWYKNGKLHREDGPARIFADGDDPEEFWIEGTNHTREAFIQWQIKNGIEPIE